jgi:hypothetical protein
VEESERRWWEEMVWEMLRWSQRAYVSCSVLRCPREWQRLKEPELKISTSEVKSGVGVAHS